MPIEGDAPAWARELAASYESGAHGQFVLYGNVADRFPSRGRFVSLTAFLDAQLLSRFELVFLYDPGNGLSVARASDAFQKWPGAQLVGAQTREPRAAVELITRYLRYRANLSAMGRDQVEHIACIMRGADQVLPANRQGEFETASLASLVRDWASRTAVHRTAVRQFPDRRQPQRPASADRDESARCPRARAPARCRP
jgi:hypothetical protein